MGNEFSWPCADRKAQKRRIRESRYDETLFEYNIPRESEPDLPKLLEVENILAQQNPYLKKPAGTTSLSTTKSSSERARQEFQENIEDPDINDDFLPLLLTSRSMQPFEDFIRDLKSMYESKLVPITICPHPFQDNSIVMLQSREKYNNFRMSKITKFNISRSKKVFKVTANLLEEVMQYMSSKNQEGLSFIGCYTSDVSETSIAFQFVYLQQELQNTAEKPKLEFEVLHDAKLSNVEKILAGRAKKNFIFRGTINIPNYNGFEFEEGVNLQAMVFEKAFASYSYHTIEMPKSDLSSEVLVTKVSRQINDYCESKVYLM